MALPSDLEIAQGATLRPLHDVAADMGLGAEELRPYGDDVARSSSPPSTHSPGARGPSTFFVTRITPTPLGEGKTTVTIGLARPCRTSGARRREHPSALHGAHIRHQGGAAGGGLQPSRAHGADEPAPDGDFHAVTAANNMLAALVDTTSTRATPRTSTPRRSPGGAHST